MSGRLEGLGSAVERTDEVVHEHVAAAAARLRAAVDDVHPEHAADELAKTGKRVARRLRGPRKRVTRAARRAAHRAAASRPAAKPASAPVAGRPPAGPSHAASRSARRRPRKRVGGRGSLLLLALGAALVVTALTAPETTHG